MTPVGDIEIEVVLSVVVRARAKDLVPFFSALSSGQQFIAGGAYIALLSDVGDTGSFAGGAYMPQYGMCANGKCGRRRAGADPSGLRFSEQGEAAKKPSHLSRLSQFSPPPLLS